VTISSVRLALWIGPGLPGPAPAELMRALRAVEVTQTDSAPCGFQLTFQAELSKQSDFAIVRSDLLRPFSRVLVQVIVDGDASTLIDGFITHQQYLPSNGPDLSAFVVTGEDVSVKMDLVAYSLEYPAMPDPAIAEVVLTRWLALGIAATIVPTPVNLVPFSYVPQQSGTDRAFMQELAQRNGNIFYVTPGPVPFLNVAYWGPPPRIGAPSAVLNVAVGAAATVKSMQAQYDALAPSATLGYAMETTVDPYEQVPVTATGSTRVPPLAARPALTPQAVALLEARVQLWPLTALDAGLDPVTANVNAQNQADLSTDAVVSVRCDVSPLDVGRVLQAPDIVGLRGAGRDYDGLYYLKSASHQISLYAEAQWNYTQSLVLTREGVGTTTQILEAP
jgi:hypothetical protein